MVLKTLKDIEKCPTCTRIGNEYKCENNALSKEEEQ